jgi:hypothetical protein
VCVCVCRSSWRFVVVYVEEEVDARKRACVAVESYAYLVAQSAVCMQCGS